MTRCQATISYRPMGGDLSGGGARGSSGQATPVENRRALVLRGRCTPAFSRPLTPFHRAAEMMRTGPTRRGRQVNYGAVLYCFDLAALLYAGRAGSNTVAWGGYRTEGERLLVAEERSRRARSSDHSATLLCDGTRVRILLLRLPRFSRATTLSPPSLTSLPPPSPTLHTERDAMSDFTTLATSCHLNWLANASATRDAADTTRSDRALS